jgi:small subunit ribosomal protein S8e
MVAIHGKSKRSRSGAKIVGYRKKRKYEMGRFPIETRVGQIRMKVVRTKGGGSKLKLFSTTFVNVVDPATSVTKRVKIERVLKNYSSVDYDRRGIITKGTLLATELGKVRVTSRPGQHGILNGILEQE